MASSSKGLKQALTVSHRQGNLGCSQYLRRRIYQADRDDILDEIRVVICPKLPDYEAGGEEGGAEDIETSYSPALVMTSTRLSACTSMFRPRCGVQRTCTGIGDTVPRLQMQRRRTPVRPC